MLTLQSRVVPSAVAEAPTLTVTTSTALPSMPRATITLKKLSAYAYLPMNTTDDDDNSSSSEDSGCEMKEHGYRLFELDGLKIFFQHVQCKECNKKGLVYTRLL